VDTKRLKVISGGQTGADLAGLWAAKLFNITTGGRAPLGWRTTEGSRPQLKELFALEESASGYHGRTLENCELSSLTLIFASNIKSPGTKLTLHHCVQNGTRYHVFPLGSSAVDCATSTVDRVASVINHHLALTELAVINVAGNSTATSPQTFTFTFMVLCQVFEQLLGGKPATLLRHDLATVEATLRDCYEQATFERLTSSQVS
jgi:hypothetical protein